MVRKMEIFFCFVSSAAPQAVLEAAPIGDNNLFSPLCNKEFFQVHPSLPLIVN
jgi:hypothetical protein